MSATLIPLELSKFPKQELVLEKLGVMWYTLGTIRKGLDMVPIASITLHKTDGEWIITQRDNGILELKVYGDSLGRSTTYTIRGYNVLPSPALPTKADP